MPSLTRVQRVMLWSDGEIEYKMETARKGGPVSPSIVVIAGVAQIGGRGRRGSRAGERGGMGRQAAVGWVARGRRRAARGPGGAPGIPWVHVRAVVPEADQVATRSVVRGTRRSRDAPSGEGWVLLREGEKPPEPSHFQYDWDDEETPTHLRIEAPDAEATGAVRKSRA